MPVEDVQGQQHHDPVGINDVARERDHSQTVCVAIQGQAQVGIHQPHGLDQVDQVFRRNRFDRGLGADGHKDRRLEWSVQGLYRSAACPAITGFM